MPTDRIVVCALYRFVRLDDYRELRQALLKTLERHQIRGTLLLAGEGINGTVAGPRAGIDALLNWLRKDDRLAGIDTKESLVDEQPFKRTKVKLKREIVTMGVEGIDPNHVVGTYVKPADWNALIAEPDVVLVDTRNDYEVQVGTFEGAINPETDNFRQFPQLVADNLDPSTHKRVAMFCTGGIRCEKSTALLKARGFEEVYHLQGGILNYLAQVPEAETSWRGECFVFDDRVTVDHALERGSYQQCNACRMPLSEADLQSNAYQRGVSCPHCIDQHSETDRRRFAERERQLQLARSRGDAHLGADAAAEIARNRALKYGRREAERARQLTGKG